jgi:molybdate transport system substrate-binding protein
MTNKMRYLLPAWLVILLGVVPAAGTGARGAEAAEVLVAAAASLNDAFKEAVVIFEKRHPQTKIILNIASSGTLCVQIEQGAPVDLFASASQAYMDRIEKAGLIRKETRRDFVANTIVLIEPAMAAIHLKSLSDLKRPEVRHVAMGDPSHVPAGRYAYEALSALGLWSALQKKLVLGVNVRQVRDYVARGEVEAGLVFASDAQIPEVRIAATVSEKLHSRIRYPAAVLKEARQAQQAEDFLAFLLSPQGQEIMTNYGFRPLE